MDERLESVRPIDHRGFIKLVGDVLKLGVEEQDGGAKAAPNAHEDHRSPEVMTVEEGDFGQANRDEHAIEQTVFPLEHPLPNEGDGDGAADGGNVQKDLEQRPAFLDAENEGGKQQRAEHADGHADRVDEGVP